MARPRAIEKQEHCDLCGKQENYSRNLCRACYSSERRRILRLDREQQKHGSTCLREKTKGRPLYYRYRVDGRYICSFCGRRFEWKPIVPNITFPAIICCSRACKKNHFNPGQLRKVKSARAVEIEEFAKDLEAKSQWQRKV